MDDAFFIKAMQAAGIPTFVVDETTDFTELTRAVTPPNQVQTWVRRAVTYVEAMPSNTMRAKKAAEMADALERRYSQFIETDGDSAPDAQAADFMLGITELTAIARREAVTP